MNKNDGQTFHSQAGGAGFHRTDGAGAVDFGAVQPAFLEDFYVSSKMKILEDSMEFLNEHDIAQGSGDFSLYCTNNNLSYAVASANYSRVYTNMIEESGDLLAARLFGYMAGIDDSEPVVLKKRISIPYRRTKISAKRPHTWKSGDSWITAKVLSSVRPWKASGKV